MATMMPDGTDRQVHAHDPCWEFLGLTRGDCTNPAAGWIDGRTFCAKHLKERQEFRETRMRPGGGA